MTQQAESGLADILNPDQQQRLHQLIHQSRGKRMMLRADVIEQLSLSPENVLSPETALLLLLLGLR